MLERSIEPAITIHINSNSHSYNNKDNIIKQPVRNMLYYGSRITNLGGHFIALFVNGILIDFTTDYFDRTFIHNLFVCLNVCAL